MLQKLLAGATTVLIKYELLSESFAEPETGANLKPIGGVMPILDLEYPGDRCCTFYEKRDYGGNSHIECMSTDESEHIYQPGDFGNQISSFECGKNVRYEFHNHNSPSTGYEVVTGAGHVRSSRLEHWMEDRVTEVILRPYDQKT